MQAFTEVYKYRIGIIQKMNLSLSMTALKINSIKLAQFTDKFYKSANWNLSEKTGCMQIANTGQFVVLGTRKF